MTENRSQRLPSSRRPRARAGATRGAVTAVAVEPARAEEAGLTGCGAPELAAVVLVGGDGSGLSQALEQAGLSAVAVAGEDAVAATRLAIRQLGELRALRDRGEARATVERAKGLLMARHDATEREAYDLLRAHARRTNQRVIDVAAAVLASHPLLSGQASRAAP